MYYITVAERVIATSSDWHNLMQKYKELRGKYSEPVLLSESEDDENESIEMQYS